MIAPNWSPISIGSLDLEVFEIRDELERLRLHLRS